MTANDRLTLLVASVICVVWAAGMVASFVNDDFSPPESLNLAFGALTAYLFSRQIRKEASP